MNQKVYPLVKRLLLIHVLTVFLPHILPSQSLPAGFVAQKHIDLVDAIGLTFDASGTMHAWTQAGEVYIVDQDKNKRMILDISDEVGNWRDYGLTSVALDPNYLSNGYIYLFYVVDRHHLLYFGTNFYQANANEYFDATIARLTRYTVNNPGNPNQASVNNNSRNILFGATADDGVPILHQSHGSGTLVFAQDGSLMVSTGDGASYQGYDEGSQSTTYWQQGLNDGIITNEENVGAYRSQQLFSMNGKILRINPANGNGYPSNPFYQNNNPGSTESRVWSFGLRNPFQMTGRPNTGSHFAGDGDPGTFLFGDVGWNRYEEINIVDEPGRNYGWPWYEGVNHRNEDYDVNQYSVSNNGEHKKPTYTIFHADNNQFFTRVSWDDNVYNVGSGAFPDGEMFPGNCSIGGDFNEGFGTGFPEEYHGAYFQGDFGRGWIKYFGFDEDNVPTFVRNFGEGFGNLIFMEFDQVNGGLYYISSGENEITKITYTGSINQPPVAIATSDIMFGSSPLTVSFSASQSYDPEGKNISFNWDFGDGSTSNEENPTHTFVSGGIQGFTVTLEVEDNQGNVGTASLVISVNNTPPVISSTSVDGVDTYNLIGDVTLPLSAIVSDAEHPFEDLTFEWLTALYHDDHHHPEPIDNQKVTQTVISPIGCDGATYWYRINLTVTDPGGLSAFYQKDIFPECGGADQFITFEQPSNKVINDGPFSLNGSTTSGLPIIFYITDGPATIVGNTVSLLGIPGAVTVRATQAGNENYNMAEAVERTFQVFIGNSNDQTINFPPLADKISFDPPFDISATASSELPVSFNILSGPAILNGNTVSLTGDEGTVRIRASQQGNQDFNPAPDVIQEFFVSDPAPRARFTVSTDSGFAPLLVDFEAYTSTDPNGSIVDYYWDFGTGDTASGVLTSYTFNDSGLFTVTLIVTDDENLKDTATVEIESVEPPNRMPIAIIQTDTTAGEVPLTMEFDGSSSFDQDGNVVSYEWDFNDGGTATGAIVTHTFTEIRLYTVVLKVTDNEGGEGFISRTINVTERINDIPFAIFSADATSGEVPITINFDATDSYDGDGEIVEYLWSFGDGTVKSGQTISHTYQSAGTFTVTLRVKDNEDAIQTATETITLTEPVNLEPIANFTADPLSGQAPLNVGFDATGSVDPDGTIVSYFWNFDDGAFGSGANPSHVFTEPGVYNVTLIVRDNKNASDNFAINIVVDPPPNIPPVVNISATPNNGITPLNVAFDGSGSSDPDGSIVAYVWEFGDGNTGNGASISHQYTNVGSYMAKLTVTDNKGATATDSVSINVTEIPNKEPKAEFFATPIAGFSPLTVNFNASQSTDSDGNIVSYAWDFDNGDTGTGVTTSYTFDTAGVYNVVLTVTDNDGSTATKSETITVNEPPNEGPIAFFIASPGIGFAPLTIEFDGTGSSDPDGSIVLYTWDFGNGDSATGAITTYTYFDIGVFPATLTVTDDDGETNSFTINITVEEVPNVPPVPAFTATPDSGSAPLEVIFDGRISTDEDGTIVTYLWDFGEGSNDIADSTAFTYGVPGEYTVTLTVVDDDGDRKSISKVIKVSEAPNQPPVPDFTVTPETGEAPLSIVCDASDAFDPDGQIIAYVWNFGNGKIAEGPIANFTYEEIGPQVVSLSVLDNEGAQATATKTIIVSEPSNRPPIADFTLDPDRGEAPLKVDYDGSASSDPDGDPITLNWKIGESDTDEGTSGTYLFTNEGEYTIQLVVTDSLGLTDTLSKVVTVLAPSVSFDEGIISFFPNPAQNKESVIVNYLIANDGKVNYAITDLMGQTLWEETAFETRGSLSKELTLDGMSEGIYILSIRTWQDVMTQRFMIHKP